MTTEAPFLTSEALCDKIEVILSDKKAEDIVRINLKGKSTIADYLVIATGHSLRQLAAIADSVKQSLKDLGYQVSIEGMEQSDWVLIDAQDIIIHLFRPEARSFYNLEKMWGSTP
jgi:ribosome-associated protein